jgi:hypothetical protein
MHILLTKVVRLFLLVSFGVVALPAVTASANDCTSAKEQVYWIRSTDNPAFGTQNTIPVKDRTLAADCQADAENHHTANIRDTAFTTQAEAGYVEMWGPNSSHVCRAFWEVGMGSATVGDFMDGFQISCTLGSVGVRVVNVAGTNNWNFYYNVGGGYTQFGPSNEPAGFHQGYPRGESGRRGDPGTFAADDQSALRWKTVRSCTSGCWNTPWTTNIYDFGCVPGWIYSFVARDEFKITSGSHTC